MNCENQPQLVLVTNKKEGLLKRVPCYLIFHQNSLVLAHLNKKRQKEEMKKFQKKVKEEGGGFIKRTMIMIDFWNKYGERYYDMDIDDVFNEDSSNYSIDYNQTQKFVFKSASTKIGDEEGTKKREGKIVIYNSSNKIKLTHNYYDNDKRIKNTLNKIYGTRLKYTRQMWR